MKYFIDHKSLGNIPELQKLYASAKMIREADVQDFLRGDLVNLCAPRFDALLLSRFDWSRVTTVSPDQDNLIASYGDQYIVMAHTGDRTYYFLMTILDEPSGLDLTAQPVAADFSHGEREI